MSAKPSPPGCLVKTTLTMSHRSRRFITWNYLLADVHLVDQTSPGLGAEARVRCLDSLSSVLSLSLTCLPPPHSVILIEAKCQSVESLITFSSLLTDFLLITTQRLFERNIKQSAWDDLHAGTDTTQKKYVWKALKGHILDCRQPYEYMSHPNSKEAVT